MAIGVAYLVWGILGGVLGMLYRGDTFQFTGRGGVWGFIAGSLGALGALALTWAMFEGGNRIPHIVMSIVFGGAVTIAALVGVWQTHEEGYGTRWLWVGIVGMLISAVLVAYNTPHEKPPVRPPGTAASVRSSPLSAERAFELYQKFVRQLNQGLPQSERTRLLGRERFARKWSKLSRNPAELERWTRWLTAGPAVAEQEMAKIFKDLFREENT